MPPTDQPNNTKPMIVDERIRTILPAMDMPFFQAGLAGYSDAAMRLIARQHGCPYCITEALLDRPLLDGGKGLHKADPVWLKKRIPETEQDHPLAGQIIGTDPDQMAQAARLLADLEYDVIDINLACPVRKMARKHRGGHFLAHPEEAITLLQAVRDAVPEEIPTTVKLRRATDDSPEAADHFEQIFEAIYDIGYAWTTVHARTVKQKYEGPSNWNFLRDLVDRHPQKIIFGSGDIWQAPDIFHMMKQTGVHAVSVARGCIGNPWIFQQARQIAQGQSPTEPTLDEQRQVLLDHFNLSTAEHGEQLAGRLMRKFGIKFSHHHPEGEQVKTEFIKVKTTADWRVILNQFY